MAYVGTHPMTANLKIREFMEQAKASGASEQILVGILTARGWPEKEAYEALAAHYEGLTGIEVPRRASAATAAKDAFFYLLAFSTLATWTIGLGSLSFSLIDQWLADTLFSAGYNQAYETYGIATAMASILVAFPIYFLVTRTIIRDVRSHPEKLNSSVRKWLTYMALVIAAGVFIGDLVAALTYLLRGEITSRFLAKAFAVLVISGGVFFYYYFGQRKPEDVEAHRGLGRDLSMAIVSALVVMFMIILGFAQIGGPGAQRLLRGDEKRLQDLYLLSQQIANRARSNGNLPAHDLSELSGVAISDPMTRVAYEYHLKEGSKYELCAIFSSASRNGTLASNPDAWSHPAGRYCFPLDATQQAQNPYIFLPNSFD
jgi:hypothetical protein